MAGLWQEKFTEWAREASEGKRPAVPPVFIIVCKDTRLAKVVYEWITGEGTAPPIEEFRNRDGREYTVRIDSRVVEEIESGVAKSDEGRRLRFVLDTIGKTVWPGGEIPAGYLELTEKLNRKAIEGDGRRIDPRIPPGRDVRCIVSVAMLTEGWDATTVTHIVGLRPFDSQLLCEQVVGRGLRRSQYHDLTVEEVAKVYGVPFELIPLKATDKDRPAPPPKIHHIHALPERDRLEIRFPRVEGYAYRVRGRITVAWERMPMLIVDPMKIPDETKVKGLSTEEGGRLSLMGPGKTETVTLQPWREPKRVQELEFDLALALTRRYTKTPACEVPPHALFPQILDVVKRFLQEKVQPVGRTDRKDVFLEPYRSDAVNMLAEAIVSDDADSPELPRYEAHRGEGSTKDVDFWTSKPVRECERSHLNWVVADTEKWEQTAAFYLDSDERVVAFVKNFNLGFAVPYNHNGEAKEYLPDFLVRLQQSDREVGTLILETKGYDPLAAAKEAGARRWVAAVNADGSHGRWAYRLIKSPTGTSEAIRSAVQELVGGGR